MTDSRVLFSDIAVQLRVATLALHTFLSVSTFDLADLDISLEICKKRKIIREISFVVTEKEYAEERNCKRQTIQKDKFMRISE